MNYPAIPSHKQMDWYFTCVLNEHNPDEIVEFAQAIVDSDSNLMESSDQAQIMREIMVKSANLKKSVLRDVWGFLDYATKLRNFAKMVRVVGGIAIFTLGILSVAQYIGIAGVSLSIIGCLYIFWELLLWDARLQAWEDTLKAIRKKTGASKKEVQEVFRAIMKYHNASVKSLLSKDFQKKIQEESIEAIEKKDESDE